MSMPAEKKHGKQHQHFKDTVNVNKKIADIIVSNANI